MATAKLRKTYRTLQIVREKENNISLTYASLDFPTASDAFVM